MQLTLSSVNTGSVLAQTSVPVCGQERFCKALCSKESRSERKGDSRGGWDLIMREAEGGVRKELRSEVRYCSDKGPLLSRSNLSPSLNGQVGLRSDG